MDMEMKKHSNGRIYLFVAICALALLLGALWFLHESKYCATAEDAAKIYVDNRNLFIDCQLALAKNADIVYVSYDEDKFSAWNVTAVDHLYFETRQPVEEDLSKLASTINRLNDKVPLRSIQLQENPKQIKFVITTTNILNAVVVVYSEDGIFPEEYISDLKKINANWAAYITGE